MCLFIMLFCFRLGESCSHVAAVLLKVEAAVHVGDTRRACTELREEGKTSSSARHTVLQEICHQHG